MTGVSPCFALSPDESSLLKVRWLVEYVAKRVARSSAKNTEKTEISAMPCAQGYSVMAPVRHGFESASFAGVSNYIGVRC